jgi:cytochrome c oxidase subunit 1
MNAPLSQIRRYTGLADWLTTVDHKKIGLLYFWFTVFMAVVGGALSGLIRVHLATPGSLLEALERARLGGGAMPLAVFTDGHAYNQVMTMHASVMLFFVLIPAWAAFGNYLVPLQIGARDMAFPKLNAFAFWLLVPAALLMFSSFVAVGGSAASGWTAYPPLSLRHAGPGQDMWIMGIHLAGLSSILGSINFIVTIANMRAPGMGWLRMPLFPWAVFINSLIQLTATPVLGSAVTMLLLDRNFGTTFLDHSRGGDPLLYQHVFWFYSHPAVYLMILPGFGGISHVIAAFSRKRIFGYPAMIAAVASIAALGFMVWGHHMFSVGMPPALQTFFMYATFLIALPTGLKIFSWLATMWGGSIRFTTAMKFAAGFLSLFTIGGFGGLILATVPIDQSLHDTYFVVGHFHFTMVGGSVMLMVAMTYFWWPKMSGRFLSERLGTWVFWLMFLGLLTAFFTMHISGMAGMARRIAWYYADFRTLNLVTSAGFVLAFSGALLLVADLVASLARPRVAADDAWGVNDLQGSFEWATSSPPPAWNFDHVPPIPVIDQYHR